MVLNCGPRVSDWGPLCPCPFWQYPSSCARTLEETAQFEWYNTVSLRVKQSILKQKPHWLPYKIVLSLHLNFPQDLNSSFYLLIYFYPKKVSSLWLPPLRPDWKNDASVFMVISVSNICFLTKNFLDRPNLIAIWSMTDKGMRVGTGVQWGCYGRRKTDASFEEDSTCA